MDDSIEIVDLFAGVATSRDSNRKTMYGGEVGGQAYVAYCLYREGEETYNARRQA